MAVIIRLQNLPWSANAVDIRRFFAGRSIPEGGVHIVGGEDGDAFIAFSSDEDARLAMRLDSQQINGVRVRLYLSSKTEMQSVITAAREVAASKPQVKPSAQAEQTTGRMQTVVSSNEAPQLVSQSIHLNRDYLSKTQLTASSTGINYEGTEQWPNYLSQDQYQRSITHQPDLSYDTSHYQEPQGPKQLPRSYSPRRGHMESPRSQHSSYIIDEMSSSPTQLDRHSDKSYPPQSWSRLPEYEQIRSSAPRLDTESSRFRQAEVGDPSYHGHFDSKELRQPIREPQTVKSVNVTHSYNQGDDRYSFEGPDNVGCIGVPFIDDKPPYRSSNDVPLSSSREGFHDRIPLQQSYMDDTVQPRIKGEPYDGKNIPLSSQRARDGNSEYSNESRRLDEQLDMRNTRSSDRSVAQDRSMPTRDLGRDGRSDDPYRYSESPSVHSYRSESHQSSNARYRDFRRTEEQNPLRNQTQPQGYRDHYSETIRDRYSDRNREQRSDFPSDQYSKEGHSQYSEYDRSQSTQQLSRNPYSESNRSQNQSGNREPFFDKKQDQDSERFQQDFKQIPHLDRVQSPTQSGRQGLPSHTSSHNLNRGPTQDFPPRGSYPGPSDNRNQDSGYNQSRFPPQNRDQRPPKDQFQHQSPHRDGPPPQDKFQNAPPNRDQRPPQDEYRHPPPSRDQRPPPDQFQHAPPSRDQRPPPDQFQNAPPSRDQRPPPDQFQNGPPSRDQRPPLDQYQNAPPSRDQHPPRDQYQHPPPSRDQRPAPDQFQHPPPSRDQRPPQDQYQHPPSSRDQRPAPDQFQHPPPSRDQRPPQDQYQHPPQSRDRLPPDDQFHRSTQNRDQRPLREQYPPPNRDQRSSQDPYQHPPQSRDQFPGHGQYRGPRQSTSQYFEGNRDHVPDSYQNQFYGDNQDMNPGHRGDRPDRNRDMIPGRNSSQQETDRSKFHERDPHSNQAMPADRKFSGGQDAYVENYPSRGRRADDMTEHNDLIQQRSEYTDHSGAPRRPPEDHRFPPQRPFKEDPSERSISGSSRPERGQQYQSEGSNSILGRRYGPMDRDNSGFRQEIDFSQLPPWLRKGADASPSPYTNAPDQRPPMRHDMPRQRFDGNQSFRSGMFDQTSRPGYVRPEGDDGSINRRPHPHSGGLLQTPTSHNQTTNKTGARKSLLGPPTDHDMRRPRPPQTIGKDGDSYEGPDSKRMCFDNNSKIQQKREGDSLMKQSPSKETFYNPSLFVRLTNCELFWTPRQMFSLLRNVRIGKPTGFRFEVDKIGRRTGNIFVKLASIDTFDAVMAYNGTEVHSGRLKLRVEPCAIEEFFSVDEPGDLRPSHVKELSEPLFHRDMCIEIMGLPSFYNKEDLVKLFPDSHLDVNDVRIECEKGTSKCNGRGYIVCKRKEDFESILSKNGQLVYQDPFRITAISKCQLSLFWHKYMSGGSEDHDSRPHSGRGDHDSRKERSSDRGERGDFDRSGGRDRSDDRERDRRDHRDRDRRDGREVDRRDRDRDRSSNRNADDREHDSSRRDRKSHTSDSSSKRNETDDTGNSRRSSSSNQKSSGSHSGEQQSNNTNSTSHTNQNITPQKNPDTQEQKEKTITTYGCDLRNIPRNISVSDIAQFLGRERSDTSNIHYISNQSSALVTTTDELMCKRLCAKDGQKLKLSVIRIKSLNAAELKSKLSNYKGAEDVSEHMKSTSSTASDTSATKGSSSGDKIYTEASTPVRLTIGNLPVNATVSKIEEFFHDVKFVPGSITLRISAQGKPLGEAVIDLPSSVEVDRVMQEFQGKKMGGRAISLRR